MRDNIDKTHQESKRVAGSPNYMILRELPKALTYSWEMVFLGRRKLIFGKINYLPYVFPSEHGVDGRCGTHVEVVHWPT